MKKNKILVVGLIVLLMTSGLVLSGCTSSDWAVVADSLNSANNDFANSYSSSSETGMVYTIYNRSSVTVTLYDSTGAVSITPYGTASARFSSSVSIYDVSYSPSSVKVTQSGYSFTFTN
jgi:hypothetical protein